MINKIEFSAKYLTSNAGLFLLVERTSKNGIFDLINHDLVFENTSTPPVEIESGTIVGGFSHDQVLALADKVVASVKSGTIKHFVVMGGCNGRQGTRSYYTEIAQNLPKDTVILTARYAK